MWHVNVKARTSGQSIVLIALVIVVLIGMVALAVDVGNAYAKNREAQRASNAASLSAVNVIARFGTDADVVDAIEASLASNNIRAVQDTSGLGGGGDDGAGSQEADGTLRWRASYLDGNGNVLGTVGIGDTSAVINSGAVYVRVTLDGREPTYFARVVGQSSLPVNSFAFAGLGVCTSGIYPMAVAEGSFSNPRGSYYDERAGIYRDDPKPWNRLYLQDDTASPGNASWLRWNNNRNPDLNAAWSGDGNFDQGFQEAYGDWLPSDYASKIYQPGVLNVGAVETAEWIWGHSMLNLGGGYGTGTGNDGATGAPTVANALRYHVDNRTILKLPVYINTNQKGGLDSAFQISRVDSFLLIGYGYDSNPNDEDRRTGWFADLVNLGPAQQCATAVSEPPRSSGFALTGLVDITPRYFETTTRKPIDMTVILDVSGSMSWNWDARTASRCEDRRIYIAKQAMMRFTTDVMKPGDRMTIATYSGDLGGGPYSDSRALANLTDSYPTNGFSDPDASNPQRLASVWIPIAGTRYGPTTDLSRVSCTSLYNTSGATPSAAGLAAGNNLMVSDPDRQQVFVFITDGVANVFRNGDYNNACNSEDALCNTGTQQNPGPISQAVSMGNVIKDSYPNASVFVIAVGYKFDQTGLPLIASDTGEPYFATAANPASMDAVFAEIAKEIEGDCIPKQENVTYPNDAARFRNPTDTSPGEVRLLQGGAVIRTAPIQIGSAGQAYYYFDNVPLGNYELEAIVYYRDFKDSRILRQYNQIATNFQFSNRVSVEVSTRTANGTLTGATERNLSMHLDRNVCER